MSITHLTLNKEIIPIKGFASINIINLRLHQWKKRKYYRGNDNIISCHGHDRMVVEIISTCTISSCSAEVCSIPAHWEMYLIQHYEIKRKKTKILHVWTVQNLIEKIVEKDKTEPLSHKYMLKLVVDFYKISFFRNGKFFSL